MCRCSYCCCCCRRRSHEIMANLPKFKAMQCIETHEILRLYAPMIYRRICEMKQVPHLPVLFSSGDTLGGYGFRRGGLLRRHQAARRRHPVRRWCSRDGYHNRPTAAMRKVCMLYVVGVYRKMQSSTTVLAGFEGLRKNRNPSCCARTRDETWRHGCVPSRVGQLPESLD